MEEKTILFGVIIAFVGILLGYGGYNFLINRQENYPYQDEISQVKIYSKIPIKNLEFWSNWDRIALLKSDESSGKGGITCNFEISAISPQSREGYKVQVEKGNKGIYIHEKFAYIRGNTDDEILQSCHVFSCLISKVKCPENFLEFQEKIPYENEMNLILDTKLGAAGVKAYSEILGVFGFIQAIIVDIDKDRKFSEYEKSINKVFIYPYLKNGSECKLQQFKNLVQESKGNESKICENISSGIFLLSSQETQGSEIKIQDNKIFIYGNENTIYKGAVIVRDILSPEWIRTVYGIY